MLWRWLDVSAAIYFLPNEEFPIKLLFGQRRWWEFRLILFAGLAISLIILDTHGNYVTRVRSTLAYVVTPLQNIVDKPTQWLSHMQSKIASRAALTQENANLRAQQLLLRARLQKSLALERENRQLRALLNSSTELNKEQLQVAQLLAVNIDRFQQHMILNQGQSAAVHIGQAVLDPYGVLGQVERVLPETSQVLLLTDRRSAIPVEITRNGIRAIAVGLGALQQLSLVNLPKTIDIRVGDVIVTSGLGRRYPAGYPVGVVQEVVRDPGQAFTQITVTPSAHLNRTRLVLLVKQEKKA